MGNFNQEINKPYIDDDIDIMPYIRHIFKNKMTFFKGIVLASFLAIILTLILPKQYRATISFIQPSSSNSSNIGFLSTFGFSTESLSSQTGIYSKYVNAIFRSKRIKLYVASKLVASGEANHLINEIEDDNQKVEVLISKLKLDKKVKLQKNEIDNLNVISYTYSDKHLILPVLNLYLEGLINLNNELNVDSDVLQIIPLDEAVFPKSHISPNFKILFLGFNILFFIFIFIYLITQKLFFIKNIND